VCVLCSTCAATHSAHHTHCAVAVSTKDRSLFHALATHRDTVCLGSMPQRACHFADRHPQCTGYEAAYQLDPLCRDGVDVAINWSGCMMRL
jgi:hypothetical protein